MKMKIQKALEVFGKIMVVGTVGVASKIGATYIMYGGQWIASQIADNYDEPIAPKVFEVVDTVFEKKIDIASFRKGW